MQGVDSALLPLPFDYCHSLPVIHIYCSKWSTHTFPAPKHMILFTILVFPVYLRVIDDLSKQTKALVQTESLLTQLIFEHALRIRVKNSAAPTSTSSSPSDPKPSQTGAGGPDKKSAETAKSSSLEGRLNNLISSDLQAIVSARDWVVLMLYTPLQILLCIWFLYAILEWRCAPSSYELVRPQFSTLILHFCGRN